MANAYWESVIVHPPAETRADEPGTPLPPPISRATMRDIIAGMALVFNPKAAGDLQAVVQFDVRGKEPGRYYLRIAEGKCAALEGAYPDPTLTIHTPSEVWLRISQGELNGALALMTGKYTIKGDLGLLMRFNQLFSTTAEA
jgi:putative sterol carrier protein